MKLRKLFLSFAILLALTGTSFAGGSKEPQTITIIHTNDVHGRVEVYPYVKGYADALRKEKKNVVVVSAGDEFDGTPFASLSGGRDIAEVMNLTGYDLFVMGNHEQFPQMDFQMLATLAKFPILAANIGANWKTQIPQIKNYTIKKFGATKIAFIGITTGTSGDESVAVVEKARKDATKEGANVFIAVTHLGVQDPDLTIRSTYIAEKCPWLTAIIDGHCHTAHSNGLLHNGILIGETGEYGNNIGVVEVTAKKGEVLGVTARLIPIAGHQAESGIIADAAVQTFIDTVNTRNAAYLDEVLFTLPTTLIGTRDYSRRVESVFGDMLTDAMRLKTGAQIGLLVGTAIRANIDAGEVTRGELKTALYEDLPLCTLYLSGAEIRGEFETALKAYPNENNYFLHVSGLFVEFDTTLPVGERVTSIKLENGAPLEPDTSYLCVSKSDSLYFVSFYDELMRTQDFNIGFGTIAESLADYITGGAQIPAGVAGRIKPIN
ncbi:putative 5'-Nucleotidase domain protein [Treponema primitia ZAS-2]|uniref:Putative 5'-Nucleotidase domain protein n=1 Tax=Treponema primitia (strain ATCC BAA-887 / DSM 12427 / ZAS-2) TaxID=545694 RepID=F5YNM9_TREPZ|nr:bifunctional UDP-sugar hydrolase/5'-nucleotidase [Treponema primitia]AEF86846.1 putative 5'-Nucleotidase domain protein [Treponema primitia ZAS-2]